MVGQSGLGIVQRKVQPRAAVLLIFGLGSTKSCATQILNRGTCEGYENSRQVGRGG